MPYEITQANGSSILTPECNEGCGLDHYRNPRDERWTRNHVVVRCTVQRRKNPGRRSASFEFSRSKSAPPDPDSRIVSAGLLSQLSSPAAATAAFTGNVAVTAKDRAVTAGLKRHRRWLSAIRTNHRRSLSRSRTVTPATASSTAVGLLGLAAWLAALWG